MGPNDRDRPPPGSQTGSASPQKRAAPSPGPLNEGVRTSVYGTLPPASAAGTNSEASTTIVVVMQMKRAIGISLRPSESRVECMARTYEARLRLSFGAPTLHPSARRQKIQRMGGVSQPSGQVTLV